MSKYTDRQIAIAKEAYCLGNTVREAGTKAGIPASTVQRYAKELGWLQSAWDEAIDDKATAITTLIKIDEHLAQNGTSGTEIDKLNAKAFEKVGLINLAENYQSAMFELLNTSIAQAQALIENSVDGKYIKGEGVKGTTYGLTSEIVKNLAQAMPVANQILGIDKGAQTNVQVNNTTTESTAVNITLQAE